MPRMIASKSMTYGTRRLKADDEFTAPGPMSRALSALGMAKPKRKPGAVPAIPEGLKTKVSEGGKGEPVTIPADWESMHWASQEKLALDIIGGEGPLVTAEGQTRAQKAKAIIAAEVAERASRAS